MSHNDSILDMDVQQAQDKLREDAIAKAKLYAHTFSGEGKKVLDDLYLRYVHSAQVSRAASNIEFESGLAQGAKDVVLYIINQMEKAKIL